MRFLGVYVLLYLTNIGLIHGTQRHVIIYPKLFRLDTNEEIVVNLHGYGGATLVESIDARIRHPRTMEETVPSRKTNLRADDSHRLTLKVPGSWLRNVYEVEYLQLQLLVSITIQGNVIREEISVGVTGERDNLFVMTDRPIYQPGEEVKIRIAALDGQMVPANIQEVNVSIETKEGIAIWKDTKKVPDQLFVSVDHKMPARAPLDTYYVVATVSNQGHTSRGIAEFEVDKYVLPTFSVNTRLDMNTVAPNGTITGRFNALYTYGKKVIGKYSYSAYLHVPDEPRKKIFSYPNDPVHDRPGIMKGYSAGEGSIRVTTNNIQDSWEDLIEKKATISITVSVLGDAEGVIETDTIDGILITNTRLHVDLSQTSKYFVPGMEHTLKVALRDVVTDAPIKERKLVRVSDGTNEFEPFGTDDQGQASIPITIRSYERNKVLTVTVDNAQSVINLAALDTTNGYLKISGPSYAIVENSIVLDFKTQDQNKPEKIYYVVTSRGSIVKSEYTEGFEKRLYISRKMSPKIRVVGYYFNNGHMVSDSTSIEIEETCNSPELSISLTPSQDLVTITAEGPAGAQVALRGVDKAAFLLNRNGTIDRKHMFDQMREADMGCTYGGGSDAVEVFKNSGLGMTSNNLMTPRERSLDCSRDNLFRAKRSPTSSSFDDLTELERCFSDGEKENLAGLSCRERVQLILNFYDSDMKQVCAEEFRLGCEKAERKRAIVEHMKTLARTTTYTFDDSSHHKLGKNKARKEKSERWLWQTVELRADGRYDITKPYPDSITSYDIDAISLHEREGMCIAKAVEMVIMKKTFIRFFLPYSVKYMEEIQLRGAIFNYDDKEVLVTLRLKLDENLCSRASQGDWHNQGTFRIAANASASFGLTAIPITIPVKKFSVIEAEIVSSDGEKLDSIQKDLLIEESGELKEFSNSFSLDPNEWIESVTVDLHFPNENIAPGSRECTIYGFMSFLGPLIEFDPIDDKPKNLANSIRVPYGCGEQNILAVGPNVFIFKYQQTEDKEITQHQIETYIEDGYARELTHRHEGKWAVWSNYPPTIWLNAYVNKVFSHAKEISREMDVRPICESLQWLTEQQAENGQFLAARSNIHYIYLTEGGNTALTAFVLISITEVKIDCGLVLTNRVSEMREKAARYLASLRDTPEAIPNTYAAAVIIYALALYDSSNTGQAVQMIERLNTNMNGLVENDDVMYWNSANNKMPITVETTAYALMANIKLESALSTLGINIKEKINKIARWLVSQQNDRGGYQSSQATVVAIQSLAEYATWIELLEPKIPNPYLSMNLTSEGTQWDEDEIFFLNEDNKHYRKEMKIPKDVMDHGQFTISDLEGAGRGTLSYRCTYRTVSAISVCDYDILVHTELKENELSIKLNVTKLSPIDDNERQMGIIEVSLMSGYTANEDSLAAILKGDKGVVDGSIDAYEVSQSKITLYVGKIRHDTHLPLGFKMIRSDTVKGPNPAQIHVYDYYDPEQSQCTTFYSEPNIAPSPQKLCSRNNAPGEGELCKCMDGKCPDCRQRNDQISKTCVRKSRKRPCSSMNLHDLRGSVCNSKYSFVIEILEINNRDMLPFTKITARIHKYIFHKDINVNISTIRDTERQFIVRDDCMKKCESASEVEAGYFKINSLYLVRGHTTDLKELENGEKEYIFYLDQESQIERFRPEDKCRKTMKKRCNDMSEKCTMVNDRKKICEQQKELFKQVGKGCD